MLLLGTGNEWLWLPDLVSTHFRENVVAIGRCGEMVDVIGRRGKRGC